MKRITLIGMALLMLTLVTGVWAQDWDDNHHRDHYRDHRQDHMDMSLKRGFTGVADVRIKVKRYAVRIVPEDDYIRGRVEITDTFELYVDGDKIKTNKQEKKLLEDYFELSQDVVIQAKRIGYEGAKVGVEGAKLGVKAMAGVLKMLSPNYSSDDLERDMEREAEKIEKKAEHLEEKAEVIEDIVDDLNRVHRKLRRKVKVLNKLEWF